MKFELSANTYWVLTGCSMLGISSGILGSFALLRRRSLLGDALSHAALPGVCIAYLLTGSRSIGFFMLGALFAGLIGAYCIQWITRYSRIKEDTALGLVLSIFYAFGIVLLTMILHSNQGNQSGLDKYLFGQAASLVGSDVRIMTFCAFLVCLLTVGLYKEFKLLCFDPEFGEGLGFSTKFVDSLLNLLIVFVVVIGLQAVGIILMVAMLITPAATARFWTNQLNRMVIISAVVGAFSGGLGTLLSTLATGMPTGPLIVLSAMALFLFSLVFAPQRGLLSRSIQLFQLRKRVAKENVLRTIYEILEMKERWDHPFTAESITNQREQNRQEVERHLEHLKNQGIVTSNNDAYTLTEKGKKEAYQIVRNHRLWEMYLMHEEQFGAERVHREADFIEHYLTRDSVEELEKLLQLHDRTPKLPPSVHPLTV